MFEPSASILPHESESPSPKNDRKASSRITAGTSKVAYTITGPSALGMRCFKTMFNRPAPSARCASMNSRFFKLRTCPRTTRAVVSHCTQPSRIKTVTGSSRSFTIAMMRMTRNMKGKP